jgi:hypothetical protein
MQRAGAPIPTPPAGPADPMPAKYWDAVLRDPRAQPIGPCRASAGRHAERGRSFLMVCRLFETNKERVMHTLKAIAPGKWDPGSILNACSADSGRESFDVHTATA